MGEESKAVEEVAKTTGKAIDASRELGGFISKYLGGSIEQAMGMLEDRLKYVRFERQVRLFERGREFLAKRGLQFPNNRAPLQFAIPLIQAGSLEEDNWLQDRWAALLANTADASSEVEARRAFVTILEDLTSLDALLLDKIYSLDHYPNIDQDIWTAHLPDRVEVEKPDVDLRPSRSVETSLGNI